MVEALTTTLDGLEQLAEALPEDQDLQADLAPRIAWVAEGVELTRKKRGRGGRRSGRGRGRG